MSALQLWAAAELIRMTDRHRLAATLYGAVATLVTVYVYWPTVKAVFSSSIVGLMDPGSVIPMAWLAMVLVIPLGTILLVNRRLTPEARARLRRAA
jgi:hypothetical protein